MKDSLAHGITGIAASVTSSAYMQALPPTNTQTVLSLIVQAVIAVATLWKMFKSRKNENKTTNF